MKVKYYSSSVLLEKAGYLCFMHAVELAQEGAHVETEVGDFDSDADLRDTSCVLYGVES